MVVWTFWRPRDPVLSLALFVTATFLFTPCMLQLRHGGASAGSRRACYASRTDNTIADDGLAIALWSLPVTMLLFGAAHIPIAISCCRPLPGA